jgi:hypothetical protein
MCKFLGIGALLAFGLGGLSLIGLLIHLPLKAAVFALLVTITGLVWLAVAGVAAKAAYEDATKSDKGK